MNYKAPDNSLHFIEPEYAHLLPAGCVQITDEEAESIRIASLPVIDPKDAIRAQIEALERTQLMPRATREFMLLSMESMATPEQLGQNFGYKSVKAFDLQITALRSQL
jgi:hypothetical protein